MRYNPALLREGKNPLTLDSKAPSLPLKQYVYNESRYTMLVQSHPAEARDLLRLAEQDVRDRWRLYETWRRRPRTSRQPAVNADGPGEARTEGRREWGGGEGRREGRAMIDLTTSYMGLDLKNPLVVSASPLGQDLNAMVRAEEAGAAAIVLHSLFEEQIHLESEDLDRVLDHGAESFPEALSYFPDMADYNLGPEGYLEHIREAKMVLGVPLIASLNGASLGGWVRFAKEIEEAGADALELNVYFLPTDPDVTRRGGGGPLRRDRPCRPRERPPAVGRENRAVLQRPGRLRPAAVRGGGRRPGAVQPLLPAGLRLEPRWRSGRTCA